MREVPPPLRVTVPPPSRIVSFLKTMGELTVIVTGEAPQLKTIVPPTSAAAWRNAWVQVSAVPKPTNDVGADTSMRPTGASQVTGGGLPLNLEWFPDEQEQVTRSTAVSKRHERTQLPA